LKMICAAFLNFNLAFLHGDFPCCVIIEALWNLDLLTSSFTSSSLHQRKETKTSKNESTQQQKKLLEEGMGGGAGGRSTSPPRNTETFRDNFGCVPSLPL
jgi:hypothetical protein